MYYGLRHTNMYLGIGIWDPQIESLRIEIMRTDRSGTRALPRKQVSPQSLVLSSEAVPDLRRCTSDLSVMRKAEKYWEPPVMTRTPLFVTRSACVLLWWWELYWWQTHVKNNVVVHQCSHNVSVRRPKLQGLSHQWSPPTNIDTTCIYLGGTTRLIRYLSNTASFVLRACL